MAKPRNPEAWREKQRQERQAAPRLAMPALQATSKPRPVERASAGRLPLPERGAPAGMNAPTRPKPVPRAPMPAPRSGAPRPPLDRPLSARDLPERGARPSLPARGGAVAPARPASSPRAATALPRPIGRPSLPAPLPPRAAPLPARPTPSAKAQPRLPLPDRATAASERATTARPPAPARPPLPTPAAAAAPAVPRPCLPRPPLPARTAAIASAVPRPSLPRPPLPARAAAIAPAVPRPSLPRPPLPARATAVAPAPSRPSLPRPSLPPRAAAPAPAPPRTPLPERGAPTARHAPRLATAAPPRPHAKRAPPRPRAKRAPPREGALSARLPWLRANGPVLETIDGQAVILRGLTATAEDPPGAALALLRRAGISGGAACIWVDLSGWPALEAETSPALDALDDAIARHAEAGAYTVLHADAPLALAARYADEPAVLFSIAGDPGGLRPLLAGIRAVHPRALVLVPAIAPEAATPDGLPGTVLRWDIASGLPARLPPTHRQPMLVAGWHPMRTSAFGNERLMQICGHGGIGWIAADAAPWMRLHRGVEDWSRAAQAVLRALVISAGFAVPGMA